MDDLSEKKLRLDALDRKILTELQEDASQSLDDIARQARLVDGASELHKMILARHFLNRRSRLWTWD